MGRQPVIESLGEQSVQHAAADDRQTRHPANLLGITAAIILVSYSIPFIATWLRVGPSQLPMLFGPDLYFYLNMGHLTAAGPGLVMNPWYLIPVGKASLVYLHFGLAISAFSVFSKAVGGGSFALFLWTVAWVLVICLTAVWLFRRLLPVADPLVISIALALVTLLNVQNITWIHIRSLHDLSHVYLFLPYIRTFYPQTGIPLLFLYLGLQLEALREPSWKSWMGMTVVQFLGILIFPYATLLMALTTGALLLLSLVVKCLRVIWRYVMPFGIACAIGDFVYGRFGATSADSAAKGPLFGFDAKMFFLMLTSKSVLTVLACTVVIALVVRNVKSMSKWIGVATGLGYILLSMADVFLSPGLEISHHAGYLTETVLALQLSLIGAEAYRRSIPKWPKATTASVAVLVVILVLGLLTGYGMYRFFLQKNVANIEGARIIESLHLGPEDLVVAPSNESDDPATWLPLVSRGKTLFCKNSDLVLAPSELNVQDDRRAAYFFLTGRDVDWLENVLARKQSSPELWFDVTRIQERPYLVGKTRNRAVNETRARMVPLLQKVQTDDPDLRKLFANQRRILVFQLSQAPAFSNEHLSKYLKVQSEQRIGQYQLMWMVAQ